MHRKKMKVLGWEIEVTYDEGKIMKLEEYLDKCIILAKLLGYKVTPRTFGSKEFLNLSFTKGSWMNTTESFSVTIDNNSNQTNCFITFDGEMISIQQLIKILK